MEQSPQTFETRSRASISDKNRTVALVLCIFLGWIGFHRFYLGKTLSGVIYFFTFGVFGIGWFFDSLNILLGNMRDNMGYVIREW